MKFGLSSFQIDSPALRLDPTLRSPSRKFED